MHEVVIVAAKRTAIGSFQGSLANISAVELGSTVIRALLSTSGVDAADIDEVIMGNVLSAGIGQHPARQSALKSGIPASVPALTINKMCGSSMKAIMLAANSIRAKESKIVMVGGMESMSRSPFTVARAEDGKVSMEKPIDSMWNDGLVDPFNGGQLPQAPPRRERGYSESRTSSQSRYWNNSPSS
jgi:acetyl-CoA C-acetyltransferase